MDFLQRALNVGAVVELLPLPRKVEVEVELLPLLRKVGLEAVEGPTDQPSGYRLGDEGLFGVELVAYHGLFAACESDGQFRMPNQSVDVAQS